MKNKIKNRISEIENKISPLEKELEQLKNQLKRIEKQEEKEILENNKKLVDRLNEMGAEFICVDLENSDDFKEAMEDDGTLHITFGKVRGCFINNQDLKKSEWNKQATPILKAFGFTHKDLK